MAADGTGCTLVNQAGETSGGRPVISTARGTQEGSFGLADWGLAASAAIIWGSSFLLIAVGLDGFATGVITWLRVVFGFVAIVCVPAARRAKIAREDWPRIVLLAYFASRSDQREAMGS